MGRTDMTQRKGYASHGSFDKMALRYRTHLRCIYGLLDGINGTGLASS